MNRPDPENVASWIQILDWILRSLRYGYSTLKQIYGSLRGNGNSVEAHLNELRGRLRELPFIFSYPEGELARDLETQYIPAAYREISLEFYDSMAMSPDIPVREAEIRRATERMRYSARVILLGHPGMGKTTFMIHLALHVASRGTSNDIDVPLPPSQWTIPVFVPLKLLDNSRRRPLLDFITSSYEHFSGAKGFRRLMRYAEKKQLLLIIDGLDEVYLPEKDEESMIIRDINALFSGVPDVAGHESVNSELASLYYSLRWNRVWISCRAEHYRGNRLKLDLDYTNSTLSPPVVAVEMLGVANRHDLVKRLFDRYRERSDYHRDRLDEDLFFRYIQRRFDDDVVKLSYSPLFLTMLCFLYVNELASEATQHGATTKSSLSDTVMKCIGLLLVDIDENKVRGLPVKQRDRILAKRGLFTQEKLEFLQFFGFYLIMKRGHSRVDAFDLEELYDTAREFMEVERPNGNILCELRAKSRGNFVEQIVDQGVVVLVGREGTLGWYDFPHRRFREVLAASYIDEREMWESVIDVLDKRPLREFAIVLFSSTKRYAARMMDEILARARGADSEYYLELAVSCLEARHNPDEWSERIEACVRDLIMDEDRVSITEELLRYIRLKAAFVSFLESQKTAAVEKAQNTAAARTKKRRRVGIDGLTSEEPATSPRLNFLNSLLSYFKDGSSKER
jgi:Predicted NTPase (NACHT family)